MIQVNEIQYFPVVNWFLVSVENTNNTIEQYERFQKMSFRNRAVISGSNGLINLTVPIVNGRENRELIRDIKIDYSQSWQKNHWRAIVSSYSRAPFFEHFEGEIMELIFLKQVFLFDLNLAIIERLLEMLGKNVQLEFTPFYKKEYDKCLYVDNRNRWLPKNFAEVDTTAYPKYMQVFEDKFGFILNLSILDLLFCRGKL